jgi:hypothetical protein
MVMLNQPDLAHDSLASLFTAGSDAAEIHGVRPMPFEFELPSGREMLGNQWEALRGILGGAVYLPDLRPAAIGPLDSVVHTWDSDFVAGLTDALAMASTTPSLAASLLPQLGAVDGSHFRRNRMFALAVAGAQGTDPGTVLPVSVISALWWAGAEAIDDAADDLVHNAEPGAAMAEIPPGVTNLILLPLRCLRSAGFDAELTGELVHDLVDSCMLAAEGQLADTARDQRWWSRPDVLVGYLGKTGAAYGRDAVMATRIACAKAGHTTDAGVLEGWREFGQIFGILRQLHNDYVPDLTPAQDPDLLNATPTLWMTHAYAVTPPERRDRLASLRIEARTDGSARAKLHGFLRSPAVLASYGTDIHTLHRAACELLDRLAEPGQYRDALRDALDRSAQLAFPQPVPSPLSVRVRGEQASAPVRPRSERNIDRVRADLELFGIGLVYDAPRSSTALVTLADSLGSNPQIADIVLGSGDTEEPLLGVRALAGLHELVLTGRAGGLRDVMYGRIPTTPEQVRRVVRDAIVSHPVEIRAALGWPVQQHHPRRAASLLRGLAALGHPRIRLLEIGACAGMNLHVDHYGWRGDGWKWGDGGSPLQFEADGPDPGNITIVERGGCDLEPLDAADPAHAIRLHAFLPPEWTTTHDELDAALELLREHPVSIDRASATDWLEEQLSATPQPGVHTVVWHSLVWQLLDRAEKERLIRLVQGNASRRDLSFVSFEPDRPEVPAKLRIHRGGGR